MSQTAAMCTVAAVCLCGVVPVNAVGTNDTFQPITEAWLPCVLVATGCAVAAAVIDGFAPVEVKNEETNEEVVVSAVVEGFSPLTDPPGQDVLADDGSITMGNGIKLGPHAGVSEDEWTQLRDMLSQFGECYAEDLADCTGYKGSLGEYRDELTSNKPVFDRPKQFSPAERACISEKCRELQAAGFIREVLEGEPSQHAANPTIASKKKPDGTWGDLRFCMNYIRRNLITVKDKYRLPRIDDSFRALQQSRFFTKFDLKSGFAQIHL
jgi:hypothetical protein